MSDHPNQDTALDVGDYAPDFSLRDQAGALHRFDAAWQAGPVLLVFYRGDW